MCQPKEALDCFLRIQMDLLVMANHSLSDGREMAKPHGLLCFSVWDSTANFHHQYDGVLYYARDLRCIAIKNIGKCVNEC